MHFQEATRLCTRAPDLVSPFETLHCIPEISANQRKHEHFIANMANDHLHIVCGELLKTVEHYTIQS